MKSQRQARKYKDMNIKVILFLASLVLLSACGSSAGGAKTIKVQDDAGVSSDVGGSDSADVTSGQDGTASDVSTLDVKAWPDGTGPVGGPDALVVDVVIDALGIDVTSADLGNGGGGLDVKSLPETFGTDAGSDVQSDVSSPDSASDATAADAVVNCVGKNGCYACPPTTSLQLLNQCNSLSSAFFDNKARLPLLKADGSLPPLP